MEIALSKISNSGSGITNDLGILRIDNSEIVNNINTLKALNLSGAITNYGGFSEIVDSKIANNTAKAEVAGIYNSGGTIRILSTEISGNITTLPHGFALYNESGQVQIEDSRITDNVSQSYSQSDSAAPELIRAAIGIRGGSLAIKGTTVSGSPNAISAICDYVEISDSIITGNSFNGMAIQSEYAVVKNNLIEANASASNPRTWGLHIFGKENSVIFVENNLVASNGRGVYVGGNAASAIISSNRITNNSQGLSVNASNDASVTIDSNQIDSNGTSDPFDPFDPFNLAPGGLSVMAYSGARVDVLFNEITENKDSGPNGVGGVFILSHSGGHVDLSSNIIASNIHEGSLGGGGVSIHIADSGAKVSLSSNIIASNIHEGSVGGGGVSISGGHGEVNLSANQIDSNLNLSGGFGGSGGGVSINTGLGAKVSLSFNTITSNISENSGAGGVSVGGGGAVQLLGNTIQSNVGDLGGGVSIGATASLVGNTIAGNISKNPYYVHPDYFSDPVRYRVPSHFQRKELDGYDAEGRPIYRDWIIDPRYPNIYSPGEILGHPVFTVPTPEPEPEPEPSPITPIIALSNANTWLESGSENTSALRFEVKLSSASDEPVRVDYFTLDGSGSYGRLDFLPVFNNTLIFQPGETSKWIEVTAFGSQPITDTTLEIFARDTAYRQWSVADVGKELDRLYGYNDPGYKEYRVNRVFQDTTSGFDGVGLTSDEKFFLVLANPQNATIASNPVDLLQRVAKESGGSDTEAYAEASSRITGLASSNKPYTYATGVIYDQAKPPVLALRGTEVSGKDLLADFAPEGVGYRQFSSNREKLFDWLREVSTRTAPSITGHSLGGALSQWVTASYDGIIDRVATFNSPGITQREDLNLTRTTNSGVRHYITSADLVSLLGSTYLHGEWVKSSYRDESLKSIYSRILNKHSTPVVASSISRLSLDQPAPLNRALNSSTANLSDFWFTYLPDPEWLEFQVKIAKLGRPLGPKGSVATAAIAAALTYRGTTELARKGLGYLVDLITDPVDTLSAAYDAAKNYTQVAWNAIFDQSKKKLGLTPSLTEGRVDASIAELLAYKPELAEDPPSSSDDEIIGNFWDAAPAWDDAAWRATTKWSDKAWNSIQGWLPQAWKLTTEWSADTWEKPFVSMQDISVVEGDGPTTQLAFEIALSQASTSEVRVDYSLANGTALAGRDFLTRGGSVVFEAGEVSKIITIEIIGDLEVEEDKTFSVQVTNPMNALLVDDQAVVTIKNDDLPPPPTLAIAAFSADQSEGDAGSKAFSFTVSRTGDSTGDSSAIWAVTASGSNPADADDFSGAGLPSGTVDFAAGATSRTITVQVSGDTVVELDESFTVTLSSPSGATIGTTAAVVGKILNDDLPVITLAVAPTTGTTEDGTANLIYTFSRTGPTTSALTMNYTVGGTATLDTDYTGIAATPATKTVSFDAGAATAIVTVDPTADTTIEPDETVALTLAAGTGYSIGTTAAVVGTILNDDTIIEAQGNTKLLRRGDGKAFVDYGTGTQQEITSPWNSTAGSDSSEWQMLAAETISGVNKILWRNNTSSFLHLWSLDANWNWQSSSGSDAFNSPRASELETSYQVDATRDGIIGTLFTTIEAQGNTKLLKRGDGKAFVEVGGARQEITSPWGSPAGDNTSEWQMMAADTISGVNQILWRNNTSSFLHLWSLDANWNWQSASGADGFNTPRAWELETSFQVDATRDGLIGAPLISGTL